MRRSTLAITVAATSLLAVAGGIVDSTPAAADVTATAVTSVTGLPDGYTILDTGSPTSHQITVSGTATAAAGDTVDVGCFDHGPHFQGFVDLQDSVPVSNGTWTATGALSSLAGLACRFVAIPHGTENELSAELASGDFPLGPAMVTGNYRSLTVSSGSNAGKLYGYFLEGDAPRAASVVLPNFCGVELAPRRPSAQYGAILLTCVLELSGRDNGADGETSPSSSRAVVMIDGHAAYSATSLNSGLPGWQPLRVSYHQDPTSGDLSVTDVEPFSFCLTSSGDFDDTSPGSSCAATRTAGVTLRHSLTVTSKGQVAAETDRFVSTDGSAHTLAVEFANDLASYSPGVGLRVPGSSSYVAPAQPTALTTSQWPVDGSLGLRYDGSSSAVSFGNPVGSLTWSHRPTSAFFDPANQQDGSDSTLYLNWHGQHIPAGGAWTLTQEAANAASTTSLSSLTTAAVAANRPTVHLDRLPRRTTDARLRVSGTVGQGGNGGITSVAVTVGRRHFTAAVRRDGSFATTVALRLGRNHIAAAVVDIYGLRASARRSVRRVP